MSWGGLNPALTAWREASIRRLPGRGTSSDGGYADAAHGSNSQHQEDSDGTVDANDMDVNVLGSDDATGTDEELEVIEAMKKDFEADDRAHLWIHNREIAQHNYGWAENYYGGSSPHTEHVHWEARQDKEDDGSEWPMPATDRLLAEMGLGGEGGMLVQEGDSGENVKYWQNILADVGCDPGEIDGDYGPNTADAVNEHRESLNASTPVDQITGWHGYALIRSMIDKRCEK
jgi:hypothetical protein